VSVGTTLRTTSHGGVRALSVKAVDHLLVGVGGFGVIIVTGEAMEFVPVFRSDVDGQVGELAVGNTVSIRVDSTEPLVGKDTGLGKPSRVPGLIPPWQVAIEAALIAQQLLESVQVVPVPDQELGVSVDIGSQCLVESNQVLVAALGLPELARRTPLHQTPDRADESLAITAAVRIPFLAHTGVGAGRPSSNGVSLSLSFALRLSQKVAEYTTLLLLGDTLGDVLDSVDDAVDNLARLWEVAGKNVVERQRFSEFLRVESAEREGGRQGSRRGNLGKGIDASGGHSQSG